MDVLGNCHFLPFLCDVKKIVIFASGSGSNAENIVHYFRNRSDVEISVILTNNPKARVLERARGLQVPALSFNRQAFYRANTVLDLLNAIEPDMIVLAGFLWKVPKSFVKAFPSKIVNIHPALLPKYGGKGMYGKHVHEAVIKNREIETGITIHNVNEEYDEGTIVFQARTSINDTDTVEDVAKKVHALEYKHYPKIIELLLTDNSL